MWVGPGGFIGNFAFRFTIEVLFFQTISLSHTRRSLFFTKNCFKSFPCLWLILETGNIADNALEFPEKQEGEQVERRELLALLIYYCQL